MSFFTVNACVYGHAQDTADAPSVHNNKKPTALLDSIHSISVSVCSFTTSASANSSMTQYHDVSFVVSITGLIIQEVLGNHAVAGSFVPEAVSNAIPTACSLPMCVI